MWLQKYVLLHWQYVEMSLCCFCGTDTAVGPDSSVSTQEVVGPRCSPPPPPRPIVRDPRKKLKVNKHGQHETVQITLRAYCFGLARKELCCDRLSPGRLPRSYWLESHSLKKKPGLISVKTPRLSQTTQAELILYLSTECTYGSGLISVIHRAEHSIERGVTTVSCPLKHYYTQCPTGFDMLILCQGRWQQLPFGLKRILYTRVALSRIIFSDSYFLFSRLL